MKKGSYCMKRSHDFSQSQRYLESKNFSFSYDEQNLTRLGFKKCYAYLEYNKIFFTHDKTQFQSKNEIFSKSTTSYITEEIPLTQIDKTIVSKNMKNIIEVQQAIRKMQRNLKTNINDLSSLNNKDNTIDLIDQKKNMKSLNNNFNLVIQLVNGSKIEMILFSYEEFKAWLNGLAYVIKIKEKH